jgi:uncharacterized cupredoxin-like copper-binding protein
MRAGIAGSAVGLHAAAVLSACGGSDGGGGNAASASTSDSSPSSSAAVAAGSAQGAPTMVQVTAREYSFALSTTTFAPGRCTFQLVNSGAMTHGLEIDGPGVEKQKTDVTGPGGSSWITVTLQKGTYEISCPVPGHEQLGMESHITVG